MRTNGRLSFLAPEKKNAHLFLLVIVFFVGFFLRFYKISDNPPGLYIDEASIGYNAYKILTTGKDEYGYSHPLLFKSFGDYKLPVYIYSTSLSEAVFGRNEFAVRFFSALTGSLTVLVLYFFIKNLFDLGKVNLKFAKKETLALLSSFLLAISAWHIQFSRGGFEATMGLFFYLLACLLSIYFLKNKKIVMLFLSSLLLILSIYTYHTYRVISPVTLSLVILYSFYKFPELRKKIAIIFLFFLLLFFPMVRISISYTGAARFNFTSAFSEFSTLPLSKKITTYPFIFFKNYLTFFSSYFLFATGDGIGRHQIANFGPLFRWQLPFLIAGFYALLSLKRSFFKYSLLFLIFISPIPASIVVPDPHTLRSLLLVIPFMVLISMGTLFLLDKFKSRSQLFVILLGVVVAFESLLYLHYYYVHYPQVNALDWGAGYKEMILRIEQVRGNYDEVVIDENLGYSIIYYHFYENKNSPAQVPVTWIKPKAWAGKKVLYVRPYYGNDTGENIIENINFKYAPKTTFAQFWKL